MQVIIYKALMYFYSISDTRFFKEGTYLSSFRGWKLLKQQGKEIY